MEQQQWQRWSGLDGLLEQATANGFANDGSSDPAANPDARNRLADRFADAVQL